jgi:hypothetical protein
VDASEPAPYAEDGVDVTLIRWMLSLTPAERLEALENAVRSLLSLCDGRAVS